MDALGAASRATFAVVVSAYEGGVEDLGVIMEEVAAEALASGDTDTVMQVGDVLYNTWLVGAVATFLGSYASFR